MVLVLLLSGGWFFDDVSLGKVGPVLDTVEGKLGLLKLVCEWLSIIQATASLPNLGSADLLLRF